MLTTAALLFAIATPATCLAPAGTSADDTADSTVNRRTLYERGVEWTPFLDATDARRQTWHDNYARATVADAVLTRARAVDGRWHLLVVAADWCGDSAHTIPYVARLAEQVPNVSMRIIGPDSGQPIMEAHRTPDGRAATPTIVLLDADYNEVGCFVERPASLQTWFLENQPTMAERELYRQKYDWYDEDAGASTVAEVVEVLEAAARGDTVCR